MESIEEFSQSVKQEAMTIDHWSTLKCTFPFVFTFWAAASVAEVQPELFR